MSPRANRIILSHGLTGFICWYAIEKVFQKTIGITVLNVSLLAVTYIAISALLNVPTGVMADRKGRRFAIVLAAISLALCSLSAGLAHNVWQYLISIILWGFFYTTQNGAYEAILYDTLKEEGKEKLYAKYSGYSIAAFWVSIFVSSLFGAWFGSHVGLRQTYFITIIPNVANILLALSLHEPKRQKHDPDATSFSMAKQGFQFMKSSREIIQLTGTFLLVALFSWVPNEFGQLFFIELGFGILAVGLLNAFSAFSQASGSLIGHRFSHISTRFMTILCVALYFASFLMPPSLRVIGIVFFMVLVILRQIFYIGVDAEIQHTIPGSIRATVLSSIGLLNDFMLIIAYCIFGFISRAHTVRGGYLAVGGVACLLILLTKIIKNKIKPSNLHYKDGTVIDMTQETQSMPR